MPSLAVLDAVGTPAFVDALRAAWDRGDAVLPLDPRLPPPARASVLASARPDEPADEGDALVVATSGATGTPKAAVLTHEALRASATAVARRLEIDPASDRWLACLPLAHIGGLSIVVRALITETPLQLQDGFDPAAVESSSATLVSLVPTMLDRVDVSGFRVVLAGGGPDWRDRPSNVIHTYGMTETGGGVVYDGHPLEGVDVRADADGQLHVGGPMLLRCYRDGSDPKDADGWLPTGDLGAVDEGGKVAVHGRMAEMIVTGGEKVWAPQVEAILLRSPSVVDARVLGRPDSQWGHRVVALVVPADPYSPPTLEELRTTVKQQLPAFCAPKELELVDELPRTGLGKAVRH